jgi:hypothetical protein
MMEKSGISRCQKVGKGNPKMHIRRSTSHPKLNFKKSLKKNFKTHYKKKKKWYY